MIRQLPDWNQVPFKRLFAATSQSCMSKNFTDSDFLGKSNGKKWSQIWKLTNKGRILPYWAGFSWYPCFSHRLTVFLPPLLEIKCPNFLDFRNSWGKSNVKKWSQIWKLLLIKGAKFPLQKKLFTDLFFFIFQLRLNVLLPPLPKVQTFFLRFSEFLEKSNGKKWSQIWKLLLVKGIKSPPQNSFIFIFFCEFCLTSRIFWYRCYYLHRSRDALSPVCGIFCFL